MREQDVPQDNGILEQHKVVNYVIDAQGHYCLSTTSGWDPVNHANRIAWLDIQEQLSAVRRKVVAGKLSPLAYYMTRAQMDAALLARYCGVSRWRVWRHLRPGPFKKLTPQQQQGYARLFGIPTGQLAELPATDSLPGDEDSLCP